MDRHVRGNHCILRWASASGAIPLLEPLILTRELRSIKPNVIVILEIIFYGKMIGHGGKMRYVDSMGWFWSHSYCVGDSSTSPVIIRFYQNTRHHRRYKVTGVAALVYYYPVMLLPHRIQVL